MTLKSSILIMLASVISCAQAGTLLDERVKPSAAPAAGASAECASASRASCSEVAPAASPAQTVRMTIQPGRTLRESMEQFLAGEGWRLSWEVDDWVPEARETVSGKDVEEVLGTLRAVIAHHAPGAYRVVLHRGNKFVRVIPQ